jgi:Flp pilus assembly pilin Flp
VYQWFTRRSLRYWTGERLRSFVASNAMLHPPLLISFGREVNMKVWRQLLGEDNGQDIAEYAVMLAVILAIVVGTIRLIGSSANNVFSSVASSIQ